MKRIWTPEQMALLERMWLAGNSTTHIAGMIGAGISRNAVIGKARRLGLPTHIGWYGGSILKPAQARPQRPKAARGTIPGHTPTQAVPEPPVARQTASPPITFAELRRSNAFVTQCRFIEGDVIGVEATLYCGAPTVADSSYCLEHHHICRVSLVQARLARKMEAG